MSIMIILLYQEHSNYDNIRWVHTVGKDACELIDNYHL